MGYEIVATEFVFFFSDSVHHSTQNLMLSSSAAENATAYLHHGLHYFKIIHFINSL